MKNITLFQIILVYNFLIVNSLINFIILMSYLLWQLITIMFFVYLFKLFRLGYSYSNSPLTMSFPLDVYDTMRTFSLFFHFRMLKLDILFYLSNIYVWPFRLCIFLIYDNLEWLYHSTIMNSKIYKTKINLDNNELVFKVYKLKQDLFCIVKNRKPGFTKIYDNASYN